LDLGHWSFVHLTSRKRRKRRTGKSNNAKCEYKSNLQKLHYLYQQQTINPVLHANNLQETQLSQIGHATLRDVEISAKAAVVTTEIKQK